jgi:hypothetical protein
MAENTDEEHVENLANDQPENSTEEIIPTSDTITNWQ